MSERYNDITEGDTLKGLSGIGRAPSGNNPYDSEDQPMIDTDLEELKNSISQRVANAYNGKLSGAEIQSLYRPAIVEGIGDMELGQSVFDKKIQSVEQLGDLANTRGELQPWYLQIGAGLAKGAVLAGTTFADGIVGTLVGIGNAAATGSFSGFWDNPLSNELQQVNEWSETALPSYPTKAEQEGPWYTRIFTANFIGDKFLKNLGFAVGAAYSGKVYSGLISKAMGLNKARQAFKGAVTTASGQTLNTPREIMQAYRTGDAFMDGVQLTEDLAKAAKTLRVAQPTLKLTGAVSGALGEARIEAINNSKDWFDLHKQQLDDYRDQVTQEEYNALLEEHPELFSAQIINGNLVPMIGREGEAILDQRIASRFDYDKGLQKLTEDRVKMGNVDFLLNLPLLTVSDAWQFGRFYAGGFKTAKKALNIIKNAATGAYSAGRRGAGDIALRTAGRAFAEGPFEEMGQSTISRAAGEKYASELNDFYGAKVDPDAEEKTVGWIQSMANAALKTYGDVNNWEEGFIGALTGVMGVPGFNRDRSFGRGRYLQGGLTEEINEARENNERVDEIVTQLNNRVKSPEFLNYYQSAIRHNKYQNDMNQAALEGDNFSFKNAEHSQLINDIVMFDKAGRIQDLYDIIDEAGTVTPEHVEELRSITTDNATGKSVYNDMTDQEVIDQIQKQAQDTKQQVDRYRKIASDLQVQVGNNFNGDELEELTWMLSSIDNWENRFKSLVNDTRDKLSQVLEAKGDQEFDLLESPADDLKTVKLSDLSTMSPVALMDKFARSSDLQKYVGLTKKITDGTVENQELLNNIDDLGRIARARVNFIDKYNSYLTTPAKLRAKIEEDNEKALEEAAKKELEKDVSNARTATNLSELKERVTNLDDYARSRTLGVLSGENSDIAPIARALRDLDSERNLLRNIVGSEEMAENQPRILEALNQVIDNAYNRSSTPQMFRQLLATEAETNPLLSDVLARAQAVQETSKELESQSDEDYYIPSEDDIKNSEVVGYIGEDTPSPTTPQATIEVDGTISPTNLDKELDEVTDKLLAEPSETDNLLSNDALTQYSIADLIKDKKAVPSPDVLGNGYRVLWEYLNNTTRAYDFINSGSLADMLDRNPKLKVNFIVDRTLNSNANLENVVLLAVEVPSASKSSIVIGDKNYQIIGNLKTNNDSSKLLNSKVMEQSRGQNQDTQYFLSPWNTSIQKIYSGRIATSSPDFRDEERPIREIPEGSKSNLKFAVMYPTGELRSPAINTDKMVSPSAYTATSERTGRVYLMLKAADGMYYPTPVRIKRFTENSYPSSINSSKPVFQTIIKASRDIVDPSKSNLDKIKARDLLESTLFFSTEENRDRNWRVMFHTNSDGAQWVNITRRSDDGQIEVFDDNIQLSPDSIESNAATLVNQIQSLNLGFQVKTSRLADPNYVRDLIESDILTSNLLRTGMVNASIRLSPVGEDGRPLDVQKPIDNSTSTVPTQAKTPVGGQNLVPVVIDKGGKTYEYAIDPYSFTVYGRDNAVITDPQEVNIALGMYKIKHFSSEIPKRISAKSILYEFPNKEGAWGILVNRKSGRFERVIGGPKYKELIANFDNANKKAVAVKARVETEEAPIKGITTSQSTNSILQAANGDVSFIKNSQNNLENPNIVTNFEEFSPGDLDLISLALAEVGIADADLMSAQELQDATLSYLGKDMKDLQSFNAKEIENLIKCK